MLGYNAEQIGFVLAWTGLPQLVIIAFPAVQHKAIVALGNIVRKQALIMGYADPSVALAVLLVVAAAALLLTKRLRDRRRSPLKPQAAPPVNQGHAARSRSAPVGT